ncbi:MAG TPA: SIMPL domain-containing protein [Caulobacteraceae bacterium]|nr:SIMPL domain-containing protein [Caulobacteraceae bacterium]
MKPLTLHISAALVLVVAGSAAAADLPAASAQAPQLELSAHGEVRQPPDMATVSIGVNARAASAAAAMDQDRRAMARVIDALKAAGITDKNLATSGLSLSPQYVYAQDAAPRLTGYAAANELTARVQDLARLGAVVDRAVAAGATEIGSVSLAIADPLTAQNEARERAIKALEDKAALYARLTGFSGARLLRLSEGAPELVSPRPMLMSAMRAGAGPTPIEPGETTVSIDVEGTFELIR